MKSICVLGIGNAGNQIAGLAYDRKQIPVFGINASEKDLELIKSDIPIYIFGDKLGCGKDRRTAKEFVKANIKELLSNEDFKKVVEPSDIVFIVSSTGGGTGSGMAPIITDVLGKVYPNKRVVPIGILPTLNESIGAQRNTIEFLTELNDINNSYMLYDNNRYKDMTIDDIMMKINEEIVEALYILKGEYCYNTPFGMIDDMDMDKIVQLPGMINISTVYEFNEKTLDASCLEKSVLNAIATNGTCELDRDKIVKRMGVIVNISKELKHYYTNDFSELKKVVGEPVDIFEHYYETDSNDHRLNKYIVIMSGLSMPDDRIKLILLRIKEAEELLKRKKENSLLSGALEEIGFVSETIEDSRNKAFAVEESDSLDDILNRY